MLFKISGLHISPFSHPVTTKLKPVVPTYLLSIETTSLRIFEFLGKYSKNADSILRLKIPQIEIPIMTKRPIMKTACLLLK